MGSVVEEDGRVGGKNKGRGREAHGRRVVSIIEKRRS